MTQAYSEKNPSAPRVELETFRLLVRMFYYRRLVGAKAIIILIIFSFSYVRLPGNNALKNLKNNYCVHPNGGWPSEGNYLNYWPTCGSERLKLDFFDLGKTRNKV